LKKQQVAVLILLAVAAAITVGCGNSNPTYSNMTILSDREVTPATSLFTMKLDGSDVTPVQTGHIDLNGTSISANGRTIAYVNEDSNGDVWTSNADGSNAKQITQDLIVRTARISPNGKKIIYTSFNETTHMYSLSIINSDGSGNVNLTNPSGMIHCYSGSFSADSSKIAFACQGDSSNNIFTAKADGTEVTPVLAQDSFLETPSFTPDNKQILYSSWGTPGEQPSAKHPFQAVRPDIHHQGMHSMKLHSYGIPVFPNEGVAIVNVDGSNPVLILPQPAIIELEVLNSNLYYEYIDQDSFLFQINKASLDGSGVTPLSDETSDDRLAVCGFCF
jgi:Tol biopolymer transport system component